MGAASPTGTPPSLPCPRCGADAPLGTSFCPSCGTDLQMTAVRGPRRRPLGPWLLALGLLVVLGATAALWTRYRITGPGPDLTTTVRWMIRGDGDRAAQLATLSRAYETSRAVARYCLDRDVPATLAGVDWADIAAYSNASYRGFVSLVAWAAGRDAIHGRLGWLLAVDGHDGWGRPWRADLAAWHRTSRPRRFFPDVLGAGPPPPTDRRLLHLTLTSAGADGRFDTGDDIVVETLFPAPTPLRLGSDEALARREAEIERGRVWVSARGTAYDLIDARILAEFYLGPDGH